MNFANLTRVALLAAMVVAASTPAGAQARVVFRCKNPGKYTLFFPGYPDRFCWDKVLYTLEDLTPEMRAHFAAAELRRREARAVDDQQRAEFKARFEARRAAERASFNSAPARQPVRTAALAASAQAPPPPRQVELELVKGIAVGATRAEVIAKLGQPHGRISGSEESFRYGTTGGGVARIKLSEGKVTAVVLPQE